MISRYAPTPSGYLHTGNLVNFVLTATLASKVDARIALRIDDADSARVRREYLDDIFDALIWLDLPWHIGPRGVDEMDAWSQSTRRHAYEAARDELQQAGATFACECSRTAWQDYAGDACPGQCRRREVRFKPGSTSIRFDHPGSPPVVLWRRDDTPAYHLASIVDDDLLGVDVVIRGADLEESTAIQRSISRSLSGSSFHRAEVWHHQLVTDVHGSKLSKSAGAGATPLPRTDEMKQEIHSRAEEIRATTPVLRFQSPGS